MTQYISTILLQLLILVLPLQSSLSEGIEIRWRGKSSLERTTVNEKLAVTMEKLLSFEDNPAVETARAKLEQQIEYNFLRTLSSLVAVGPARAQERNNEILKLMQLTLNGELNFKPVVNNLPALLREPATTRLKAILETIRESEISQQDNFRQIAVSNSTTEVGKILDAVRKVDWSWKEVGIFLQELPEVFEGVQTIVESLEDIF
ncbi:unnamed protein product [Allacma fusca]|uniref:Uncharacterized protein n=1 Tax=Allacma fusca TaxID=39272 RepID=A0A8J2LHY0_9HEXA|nr:unnamed protein product [Allacma fusca]